MTQATDWDFFIAHAGPDTETAERLYNLLVPRSRVFLDAKCLRLGDDWDIRIAQAQRASAISLILVSDRGDAAYYQREEIAAANALARQNAEAHRVVPIFLSPEESLRVAIPYGLQLKHGIRLGAQIKLEDTPKLLFDLLEGIRRREPSAFMFANYVSQLTSPNLTDDDRLALVKAVSALPGLPESWRASITGFVPLTDVPDLVDRIAPEGVSTERGALLLGLDLRSFENTLRQRDPSLMSKCADQLRVTLDDMQPPEHVADQVRERIDSALSDRTCNGVEDELVPIIYQWLRTRGRSGLTRQ